MNERPDRGGDLAAPTFVEDLFLTDVFLIKGRLQNKTKRLSNMLEDHQRTYLTVEDATLTLSWDAEGQVIADAVGCDVFGWTVTVPVIRASSSRHNVHP